MKKWISVLVVVLMAVVLLGPAIAAAGDGPAPSSGDGVSDGSGFGGPNGPNEDGSDSGKGQDGPAPNSGDGVPDGSGF